MDSHPVAWGLDIGNSSIKAVKLSRTGTGVSVLGYAIEPISVPEGGDRDQALVNALEAIVAREEFGTTPVFAAISGRQVFTRAVNVPVINPKKMHTMVELEAQQQIPGNFNEVEWGYHSSPAADESSLDVALFAVKREVIQQLIDKCKGVGINLAGVSVPSLALYNFIKYDQQFPDGEAVIILDVGADNTDLVVYQGDQLWMRSLTTSGNDITQVFAKKFRVSVAEAETLKRQVTDSRQADKIIRVIESGLSDLVSEINRNLGFYRSQNANATLDNLVISGNTFRLPGLPEYMAEKLRLTVNILEDLDRIQMAPGLDRSHFMQDLQSLGVAMGLGLQATGAARADVNLMPRGQQAERILATKKGAAAALVVILALTVWLDYMILGGVKTENERLGRKVAESVKGNNGRLQQYGEYLTKVQELTPKLIKFDAIGANQGLDYAVLSGITSVVQDVSLVRQLAAADQPTEPDGPVLKLATAYLKGIQLLGFTEASDPFRPLAAEHKVVVQVDIPSGSRKDEINTSLLKGLRELAVPPHLKDLTQAPQLFSEVQLTNEVPGSLDWWYLNRQAIDAQTGALKPIEEHRQVSTSTLTYTCTIPALPGSEVPKTEAQP